MKSLRAHSFIVDSASGEFVDIKNGLKYSTGISRLIGLNENEIKILLEIFRNKKITIGDLELKTNLSETTIRNIIRHLQDRKMVTFSREGNVKLYSFLINFEPPEIKQSLRSHPKSFSMLNHISCPILSCWHLRRIDIRCWQLAPCMPR